MSITNQLEYYKRVKDSAEWRAIDYARLCSVFGVEVGFYESEGRDCFSLSDFDNSNTIVLRDVVEQVLADLPYDQVEVLTCFHDLVRLSFDYWREDSSKQKNLSEGWKTMMIYEGLIRIETQTIEVIKILL